MTVSARYGVREDEFGATIFDVWTGQTVMIDFQAQSGLEVSAAFKLAAALSRNASDGDRRILQ